METKIDTHKYTYNYLNININRKCMSAQAHLTIV